MAQTLMITGFLKASSLHNPGNAGYKLHDLLTSNPHKVCYFTIFFVLPNLF